MIVSPPKDTTGADVCCCCCVAARLPLYCVSSSMGATRAKVVILDDLFPFSALERRRQEVEGSLLDAVGAVSGGSGGGGSMMEMPVNEEDVSRNVNA